MPNSNLLSPDNGTPVPALAQTQNLNALSGRKQRLETNFSVGNDSEIDLSAASMHAFEEKQTRSGGRHGYKSSEEQPNSQEYNNSPPVHTTQDDMIKELINHEIERLSGKKLNQQINLDKNYSPQLMIYQEGHLGYGGSPVKQAILQN